MKAAVLQRILLCLDPSIGQSVARVFDLAKLFDELSPEAARTMAAIWQSEGKRTRPAHEPVTWDDERRSARAAAGTRAYRAPRTAGMSAARPRVSNGRKD
jgi:hypothetical protein